MDGQKLDEGMEPEARHTQSSFDGLVAQGFREEWLARVRGLADDKGSAAGFQSRAAGREPCRLGLMARIERTGPPISSVKRALMTSGGTQWWERASAEVFGGRRREYQAFSTSAWLH